MYVCRCITSRSLCTQLLFLLTGLIVIFFGQEFGKFTVRGASKHVCCHSKTGEEQRVCRLLLMSPPPYYTRPFLVAANINNQSSSHQFSHRPYDDGQFRLPLYHPGTNGIIDPHGIGFSARHIFQPLFFVLHGRPTQRSFLYQRYHRPAHQDLDQGEPHASRTPQALSTV